MNHRIAHHITKDQTTVSEVLRRHFKRNNEQIQDLINLGAIYSDKLRIFEDRQLKPKTYLRLHLQPKRFPIAEISWDGVIVHESPDFFIVNKPAGIPVHATVDNATENLLEEVRKRTGKEVFVTQRLDQPVSGLMLYAKTKRYQTRFNQWLLEKRVQKRYRATVENAPEKGLHVHYMENTERSPKRMQKEERAGWLKCDLTIHDVTPAPESRFYVDIELHSGRTHQIRIQLATLGSPIIGDKMYGSRVSLRGNIALQSRALEFPKDDGGRWKFFLD